MTRLPLTAQFPAHLKLHKGTVADICEAGGGEGREGGGEGRGGEERGGEGEERGREGRIGAGMGRHVHPHALHCVV